MLGNIACIMMYGLIAVTAIAMRGCGEKREEVKNMDAFEDADLLRGTMTTKDLVDGLALEAEWAAANIWEVPLLLPDHLMEAAKKIVSQEAELKACRTELCRKCGKTNCGVCRWKVVE